MPSPTTAFTAAFLSVLGGGGLWCRRVRLASHQHGGEQDSSFSVPGQRHAWPVVMPSTLAEDGSDQAKVAAEAISGDVVAVVASAVSAYEVDNESIAIDMVASVTTEAFGASLADHGPHAESFDPQRAQLETSTHLVPQAFTEAVQPPGLATMLLSVAVVIFVGASMRSARSPSCKEFLSCPSQAACAGTHVPTASIWRPIKVPRSAQLPRVASDNNEGVWELPLSDAEGTDCGVFDDEPHLQGSVEAVHGLEHKCAVDALAHAVLRVSTPLRARTIAACGQQGTVETFLQQASS